ncbi:holin family Hol44 protein (superfamily V) [Paenibacillus sp. BK033]|uniref:phage holin family protein n=1 Tax=Paenibacillus sp. BK033 TaxID=2512133 RepID=UPI001043AAA3|nr:phage holin family protein [Paenibacillus sp. BK033]TCN00869.1 holin family Hol44 protein (superfamily V) [Paenibacillus sp. BK033]
MEWTAIQELIDPRLIIVVAACWVFGYILKKTPRVPDWTIVYAVAVVGTIAANSLLGWSVQSVLQGVLCGAVAVYSNQVIKQTVSK